MPLRTAIQRRCCGLAPVFPAQRESSPTSGDFVLDQTSVIAIPASPGPQDLFLARMLADELGDRFDLHLKIERLEHLAPARKPLLQALRPRQPRALQAQPADRGDERLFRGTKVLNIGNARKGYGFYISPHIENPILDGNGIADTRQTGRAQRQTIFRSPGVETGGSSRKRSVAAQNQSGL